MVSKMVALLYFNISCSGVIVLRIFRLCKMQDVEYG
jgi:hypothetical protein